MVYTCKKCSQPGQVAMFYEQETYHAHLYTIHGEGPGAATEAGDHKVLACPKCKYSTYTAQFMHQHEQSECQWPYKTADFQAYQGDDKLPTTGIGSFSDKIKPSTAKFMQCSYCGKKFIKASTLQMHTEQEHPGMGQMADETQYEFDNRCIECGHSYKESTNIHFQHVSAWSASTDSKATNYAENFVKHKGLLICTASPCEVHCKCCTEKEHCNTCAQPILNDSGCTWCCPECEKYPCECEDKNSGSGAGQANQAPWEERGVKISYKTTQIGNYTEIWPINNDEIDVCASAADFYLLEAIMSGIPNRANAGAVPPHDELQAIRRVAKFWFQELVEVLDHSFQAYVDMAVGGELRHHRAVGGRSLSGDRATAWAGWKLVRNKAGNQALLDAAKLFKEFGGGSYGGLAWATPAELLHARLTGRMTPEQWVDRVFTLQHNCGVFLNKLRWAVKNDAAYELGHLQQTVLPAHAAAPEPRWNTLLRCASRDVVMLWDDNWHHQNRHKAVVGEPRLPNPRMYLKVRTLCMGCFSNPTVGHTAGCPYYLNGQLRTKRITEIPGGTRRVPEEETDHWDWSVWEKKWLPVSVDGLLRLQKNQRLRLIISCSDGFSNGEYRRTILSNQLFQQAIPAIQVFPEKEWFHFGTAKKTYSWQVFLHFLDGGGRIQTERIKVSTEAVFREMILDLSLLLPIYMKNVDLSEITPDYMQGGGDK